MHNFAYWFLGDHHYHQSVLLHLLHVSLCAGCGNNRLPTEGKLQSICGSEFNLILGPGRKYNYWALQLGSHSTDHLKFCTMGYLGPTSPYKPSIPGKCLHCHIMFSLCYIKLLFTIKTQYINQLPTLPLKC